MEWGQAKNLIWLWSVAGVLAVFFISSWRKRTETRRFGDVPLVQRLISSFSPFKRLLKRCFLLLAVFFIVLALGQPHFKKRDVFVERKGIDVIIAIDVSNSMLAKDIPPSRLEKAKLELTGLIDKLKSDRVGIVAFAGEAFIQCPLTLDKSAVKLFLSTVSPGLVSVQGTDLTKAIQISSQAFGEKNEGGKVIILLTDGEGHENDPMETVKKSYENGIHIFTIGIGTPDGSTLPAGTGGQGYKKDRQGEVVLSRLNEGVLKAIAKNAGGEYYRSSRGEVEIDRIVSSLSKFLQKDFQSQWLAEYEENYQFFVLLAIALLMLEQVLSERKKR